MTNEKEKIEELIAKSYTQVKIAAELNLTVRQVSYRVKKYGLTKRAPKLAWESFLETATEKFNGRFIYAAEDFQGTKSIVQVTCPKHREVPQSAENHLRSKWGCPKCARSILTEEGFIFRAKRAHGSKYDYKGCGYTQQDAQVHITCPEHGLFSLPAKSHLNGKGCPICAFGMTFEDFKEKSVDKYGDHYFLESSKYRKHDKPTQFICNTHPNLGLLEATPDDHLLFEVCPACRKDSGVMDDKVDRFAVRAAQIHGSKYSYNLDSYTTRNEVLEAMCHSCHSGFSETPANILEGKGCPHCEYIETYSVHTFLQEAREEHGDRYQYVLSSYEGREKPITAICAVHGAFEDTPENIGYGDGCPKCED